MYGSYKNDTNQSLGMRWVAAESVLGYPNIFGNGMWMVVPDKLALYILKGICQHIDEESSFILDNKEFIDVLKDFNLY